jgi:hypothetical protein
MRAGLPARVITFETRLRQRTQWGGVVNVQVPAHIHRQGIDVWIGPSPRA